MADLVDQKLSDGNEGSFAGLTVGGENGRFHHTPSIGTPKDDASLLTDIREDMNDTDGEAIGIHKAGVPSEHPSEQTRPSTNEQRGAESDGSMGSQGGNKSNLWPWVMLACVISVVLGGIVVALILVLGREDGDRLPSDTPGPESGDTPMPIPAATQDMPSVPETPFPTPFPTPRPTPGSPGTTLTPSKVLNRSPTLTSTIEGGILKCGIPEEDITGFSTVVNSVPQGFEVDLCHALAAAIFGTSYESHLQMVPAPRNGRFSLLNAGVVDVLAAHTTFTMDRNILEPTTRMGYDFSVPYLHDFLSISGNPNAVDCAARRDTNSTMCSGTKVCVPDATTYADVISSLFPPEAILLSVSLSALYSDFVSGSCNVIAGGQFEIAESVVRGKGYAGSYTVSRTQLSKEPLSFVTRQSDPVWSDFVNWVCLSLMLAEEQSVTQSFADSIGGETDIFGQELRNMFKNAIGAVGNYGEMYNRHLGTILPRQDINRINDGTKPLIYSHPFGNTLVNSGVFATSRTMENLQILRAANFGLRCGVRKQVGFAELNTTTQVWSGIDIDYCNAISAALFDGTIDVQYIELDAAERFDALKNYRIDVLCRTTTENFERDVVFQTSFTQTTFFDGLSFGGIPPFHSCADRIDTSGECSALKICVATGTTTIQKVRELFTEQYVVETGLRREALLGLSSGICNVVASDRSGLSAEAIRTDGGYTGPYELGARGFTKEPLACVTRQEDPIFAAFVYWVTSATFYAEEQGITQDRAIEMPSVSLFGSDYIRMFHRVIEAVGNYGEIYERNFGSRIMRSGANLLNVAPNGPQHFVPPGIKL